MGRIEGLAGRIGWGIGGRVDGRTKKRMIHVSMMVRLAGRMENQDMRGGGNVDAEAVGYSGDAGGGYCMVFGKRGHVWGGICKKLTVDVDWQWVSTLKGTLVLRGDPNSRQIVQTYKKDVCRLSRLCRKGKM